MEAVDARAGRATDASPSPDDPPSTSAPDDDDFVTVARSERLAANDARIQVECRGRHLVLVRRGPSLYAVDATCYHMGAPLLHGDIEDVPGHGDCITCPWHHYQISLRTGERLYHDMERKLCALPKKQRTHEVREVNGDVQVRLRGGGKPPSPPPGTPRPKPEDLTFEWESDRYAFKPPPPSSSRGGGGGGGGAGTTPRSGQVFQAIRGARGGRGGSGSFLGAGSGLHPGLRGRGVGMMVAESMRGGDGKAPWALAPNGGLSRRPPPPPPPPSRAVARPAADELPDAPMEEADEDESGSDDEYDYANLKNVPP